MTLLAHKYDNFNNWQNIIQEPYDSLLYDGEDYELLKTKLISESQMPLAIATKVYRGDLNGVTVEHILDLVDKQEKISKVVKKTIQKQLMKEYMITQWTSYLKEVFTEERNAEIIAKYKSGYSLDVNQNDNEYNIVFQDKVVFTTKITSVFYVFTQLGFDTTHPLFSLFFTSQVTDKLMRNLTQNFVMYLYLTHNQ